VRSLTLPGGAKCETNDNAAVDALQHRLGRGKANALLYKLESRWQAALASALLLVVVILVGVKWGIPAAAKHVAGSIPDQLAYDLGKGTLAVLDKTLLQPTQLPPARVAQIRASFDVLARNYGNLPLQLHFRRGMGPNAFALPDGTVVVTDELVEIATDEAQILSVLAHEVGHVHHRHSMRMALENSSVAAVLAAYLGDTAQLTTLSASLPVVYAQAHYSRDNETEADTFALEYLMRSGISPQHFADMLRALEKAHGGRGEESWLYLESHPPTPDRIQRFEHYRTAGGGP
jgi:Zn-dependent protease with chaperone function